MTATTFYDARGRPISAEQFLKIMYGDLQNYFGSPTELRTIWSNPKTRGDLLTQLEEAGYTGERLAEIQRLVSAEGSDIYDVLANVAYAAPPITREDRAKVSRKAIIASFDDKLTAFIDFVLGQYVKDGVGELDLEKLPALLRLKYSDTAKAAMELGDVPAVREAFTDFQKHLYE